MAVDPASALAAGKAINEVVGTLERLVGKLRAQPDLAALQLSAALDEILKTYYVVNSAFSQYVSLAVDEGGLAKGSQRLLDIASGSLSVEVARGKGHCLRIDAIYHRYLKRWFDKALNQQEYADIERAFKRLGDADGEVFLRF